MHKVATLQEKRRKSKEKREGKKKKRKNAELLSVKNGQALPKRKLPEGSKKNMGTGAVACRVRDGASYSPNLHPISQYNSPYADASTIIPA